MYIIKITGLAMILGVTVLFFVLSQRNNNVETTALDLNTDQGVATVTVLKDRVEEKSPDSSVFTKIEIEKEVALQNTVAVGEDGRALIEISDENITVLNHNTIIALVDLSKDDKQTSFKLLQGDIWARVQKTLDMDTGEYYRIETPNAVATVRGTSFWVRYVDSVTTVMVDTGTVTLADRDPVTGMIILETARDIHAGFKTMVDGKRRAEIVKITKRERMSDWYAYNVDKKLKKDYVEENRSILLDATDSPTKDSAIVPPKTKPTARGEIQNPTPKAINEKSSDDNPSTTKPTPTASHPTEPQKTENDPAGNEETAKAPTISITNVKPNTFVQDPAEPTVLTITGTGFLNVVSVFVDTVRMSYKTESDTQIRLNTQGITSTGVFAIRLIDLEKNVLTFPRAFTITDKVSKIDAVTTKPAGVTASNTKPVSTGEQRATIQQTNLDITKTFLPRLSF